MIPILCLFGTCLSFASRTVSEAQAGLFSSDNLLRMAFLPLAFFLHSIFFMEVEPVQKGDNIGTVDMDFSFLVLISICIFEQQLALVLLCKMG